MKKEIAQLWTKALRSGEFEQTTCKLESNGKYCSLGVLAVLALNEGICTYGRKDGRKYIPETFDGREVSLSYNIMSWSGVKTSTGIFTDDNDNRIDLVELNDSGASFDRIASIIDKHWMEL